MGCVGNAVFSRAVSFRDYSRYKEQVVYFESLSLMPCFFHFVTTS